MRKRDSKGVSEIVATVLMIMIVTAIGFSIFLYGMGFFTASTSARDQATQTGIATLRERFVVVDASFDISGNTASVWLYNYGETNVQINSIYINGTGTTVSAFMRPTEVINIVFTPPLALTPDSSQLLRVVSALGNFYENYYQS